MIPGIRSELQSISKYMNIYVTHASTHQKDHSDETLFNNIVDKLTRELLPKQSPKRKSYLLNLRIMRFILVIEFPYLLLLNLKGSALLKRRNAESLHHI